MFIISLLFHLLSHHINVVVVLFVLVFISDHSWSWYCRLGNFMLEDCPVVVWFLEVAHSLFRQTVSNANVHASWWQYSIDLFKHKFSVRARSVSAKNWVKGSLINDSIEGSIIVLETTNVHLLERQVGDLLLVHLLHLFHYCEADVNVCYVLVPIFVHFLT